MILYIENPKDSTKNLLELINKFSKVAGCKINIQKLIIFVYTKNELSERKNKTTPFTIIHKKKYYPCQVAQLVGASSIHKKVVGLIPSQDTHLGCGFNPRSLQVGETTDQCLPLSFSLSLFLTFSLPPFLPSLLCKNQ